MERIRDLLTAFPGMEMGNVAKVFIAIIALILAWMLRTFISKVVLIHIENVRSRYIWRKIFTYLITFFVLLFIVNLFFTGIQQLTTYLGLLSAGIAIALRDIISNFAGWVFVIWARPYSVSDRIQIGEFAGDVIDIGVFHTALMEIGNWVDADQSTGRVIKIPNGLVFTKSLANYSSGFQYIWNEIPVLVTFESNWEKAKDILMKIAQKHTEHLSEKAEKRVKEASKNLMIVFSKLTPTVYTSVKDSGILLTIRYLCEPRGRRGTKQAIWEDILREYADCDDIDFAYPTHRFYQNIPEGKPGTQPRASD